MMLNQRLCVLVSALFFVVVSVHAVTRIPLVVSDPAEVGGPWPLVGGVPFPPATLQNATQCRVLGNEGVEVPAQVDVTARWQDGSVRWLALSLVAPTDGTYALEFGPEAKRAAVPDPITLTQPAGGYVVDTGAARFVLRGNALGLASATIGNQKPLWDGAGRTLYAVDSKGRRAVVAGAAADVRWKVAVAGPVRVVLRGDGHYVTDDGERIARATVWYWFFRGCSQVKIVHTFVFTQDTDALWFREIGLDLPASPDGALTGTFDTAKAHDTAVTQLPVPGNEHLEACQADYPHFLERKSAFTITRTAGDSSAVVASGEALGEWVDLSGPAGGLTVVVRDLAEQFPKALGVSRDAGIQVKLWTSVAGRELDVRLEKLIPNYFGEWAETFPSGGKQFYRQPSNATGAAKTHELWLLPHTGPLHVETTARRAHAADERVLLIPDPDWTCASRVLHLEPTQPKDTARFPEDEAMMSDYFDRVTLGPRVFPMTGFIAWGCNPFLQYQSTKDGRWYAGYYRLQYLIEYNLRRNAWLMFVRSGERKYLEYVSRFDWFAADWSMHHEDVGKKVRGGFARQGNYHYPIFWGDRSEVLYTECSGTDLFNWYTNYYLTGDLRSLDVIHEFRDAVQREWDAAKQENKAIAPGSAGFMTLRLLVQLYMEDWQPNVRDMIEHWAHALLDPDSPNGITDEQPYGCLYKVSRNLCSTLEYWWVTGDPLAKECFLKAVDYNRRFGRVSPPLSYQNGQGAFYTQAYRWTGDADWLRVPKALRDVGLAEFAESPTLAEELAPGIDALKHLPYKGPHTNLHPLYSMPILMRALDEQDTEIGPAAWAVKGESDLPARIAFRKSAGEACTIDLAYDAVPEDGIDPIVLDSTGAFVTGVEKKVEKQHYWRSASGRIDYTPKPGQPWRVSASLTFPADLPADDYRIATHGQGRVVVVGGNVSSCVVECPGGLTVGAGGVYSSQVFFAVPDTVENLHLFCSRPLLLTRPDGNTERIEKGGETTLSATGQAGIWSASASFPTFLRLLNVPGVVSTSPELHFIPRCPWTLPPPPATPSADVAYVPGPIGQARHLPGDATITFPRGAARDDGSFENFPGYEGTVEFYFRPNWSSHDLVFDNHMVQRRFVGSTSTRLYYRYGRGPMDVLYAYFDLLIPGTGEGYGNDYGTALRVLFRQSQWSHFATTWRIDRDNPKTVTGEFTIFMNGIKHPRGRFYPHELKGKPPFTIREIADTITIGPMDGCIDELRISDTIRYTADFTPPTQPFTPDPHTAALFHFDASDTPHLRADQ